MTAYGSASSATTGSSARPTEVPLPATAASAVATASSSASTIATTTSATSASTIATETFGSGGSGAQGFLAMVIVFKIDRHRLPQQAFDGAEVFLFLSAAE